jgi:hypothetical protein
MRQSGGEEQDSLGHGGERETGTQEPAGSLATRLPRRAAKRRLKLA